MTDVYFSLTSHVLGGSAAAVRHPQESGTQAEGSTSPYGSHGKPYHFHSHSANSVVKPTSVGQSLYEEAGGVFEQKMQSITAYFFPIRMYSSVLFILISN